ncbi:MAG: carboxypeptidase regulatory-like domain-containing protein [Planctomycetota bacterium]
MRLHHVVRTHMARGVLLALVAAALGFGIWMAIGEPSGDAVHDALPTARGQAALDEPPPTGPTLVAHARAPEVATRIAGHPWTVAVQVVDAQGLPAPGVRVTLRYAQPRHSPPAEDLDARRAYGAWYRTRLRRTLENQNREDHGQPLRAEGRTDENGRVSLSSRGAGQYYVEAHPELPLAGDRRPVDVQAGTTPDDVRLGLFGVVAVEGRVVDTNGRGVAATVTPLGLVPGDGWWHGARVTTDAEGRFMAHAPPGALTFSVALGRQVVVRSRSHRVPSATPLAVVVPPLEASLDVEVVDPAGAGVPGAVVHVTLSDASTASLIDETGPDGVARFLAPAASVARIAVEATSWLAYDGAAPLAGWAPLVLSSAQPAVARITLSAGGVVTGIVRTGAGGAGLAGATVRVLPGHGSDGGNQLEASSDASGRYRLEGVPLGRHILYATHAEWFHPAVDLAARGSASPVDATIALLQSGAELARDIVMERGVVVHANERPLAGARLVPGPDHQAELQTIRQWGVNTGYLYGADFGVADVEGRFRIGRPPGSTLVLAAVTNAGASPFTNPIQILEGTPVPEVRLVVEPGATVRGRVVRGAEREAVVGASVRSYSSDRQRYPSVPREAKTDDQGRFELTGLPPVALQLTGATPDHGERVQTHVPAPRVGSIVDGVDLVVGVGHTMTLVLLDAQDDQPMANQAFSLRGQRGAWVHGATDADGRATVHDLSAGTYVVTLHAGDGSVRSSARGIGVPLAEAVTIRMHRSKQWVVEGRVLLPDGRPVPLCNVGITPPRARSAKRVSTPGWSGGGGTLSIGGTFRMVASFPPPYEFDISRPCDAEGRPLELRAPERSVTAEEVDAGPIVIRLEESGQVLVRVLGDDDQPPKGARVGLGPGGSSMHVPEDGRVRFTGLPKEGTITVFVSAPGYRNRSGGHEIAIGDPETLIRLERGGAIEGRVDWGEAAPLPSAISSRWMEEGKPGYAYTPVGDDGRFVLGGLPDAATITLDLAIVYGNQVGAARMGVSLPDVRVGSRDVVIRAGGGLAVLGRVVDGPGRGLSGVHVQIHESSRKNAELTTTAEGTFEFSGLVTGEVELSAWRGNEQSLAVRKKVQAGARNVEIQLLEIRSLRGTVVGDAAALKGLTVRAMAKTEPQGVARHAQARVQGDGSFSMVVPDDGTTYDLWVMGIGATHYGHAPGVDGASEVRVRLVPGATIAGRIEGVAADDATKLWVLATNALGLSAYARLMEDGTWTLSGLPNGPWRLTLSGRGGYKIEPLEGIENGTTGLVVRASK